MTDATVVWTVAGDEVDANDVVFVKDASEIVAKVTTAASYTTPNESSNATLTAQHKLGGGSVITDTGAASNIEATYGNMSSGVITLEKNTPMNDVTFTVTFSAVDGKDVVLSFAFNTGA